MQPDSSQRLIAGSPLPAAESTGEEEISAEETDAETQALVKAWETVYERALEDAREAGRTAERRLRSGAESAAPGLASASRWVFLSMLFGAIVAATGGAAGRNRSRHG